MFGDFPFVSCSSTRRASLRALFHRRVALSCSSLLSVAADVSWQVQPNSCVRHLKKYALPSLPHCWHLSLFIQSASTSCLGVQSPLTTHEKAMCVVLLRPLLTCLLFAAFGGSGHKPSFSSKYSCFSAHSFQNSSVDHVINIFSHRPGSLLEVHVPVVW